MRKALAARQPRKARTGLIAINALGNCGKSIHPVAAATNKCPARVRRATYIATCCSYLVSKSLLSYLVSLLSSTALIPTMAFELQYCNLSPITGLIGLDRALYWLKADAEHLLHQRFTTELCAHHVMGMPTYPTYAAPANGFYSPALLLSPVLTHAQLCEALQGATRPQVRAFGAALNNRHHYVLQPFCNARPLTRRVPILEMLSPHKVLIVPPPPAVIDNRMAEMLLNTDSPLLWPVWLACFDAWVQQNVYGCHGECFVNSCRLLSENV